MAGAKGMAGNGLDRRRFLRLLGLSAASMALAPAFDPERLLWVPGVKTFFLPNAANTVITPEWIMREMAKVLVNQWRFADRVHVYSLPVRVESPSWTSSN